MRLSFKNRVKAIKPWAFYLGAILILHFSGGFSLISDVTRGALLKTGVMNASAEALPVKKAFNYNFTLVDLKENRLDVRELKGKTIFLNIWATWCGPCRVEMPSIQKLYEQVDHDKIVFIMLSIDQQDPMTRVANFLKDKDYTFPIYLPASPLPSELRVGSIPTTFVISPQGTIVAKEVGASNYDTEKFKKFLEGL